MSSMHFALSFSNFSIPFQIMRFVEFLEIIFCLSDDFITGLKFLHDRNFLKFGNSHSGLIYKILRISGKCIVPFVELRHCLLVRTLSSLQMFFFISLLNRSNKLAKCSPLIVLLFRGYSMSYYTLFILKNCPHDFIGWPTAQIRPEKPSVSIAAWSPVCCHEFIIGPWLTNGSKLVRTAVE